MSERGDADRLGELEAVAARPGDLGNLGPVVEAVRRFHEAGASDDERGRALIDAYRGLTLNAQKVIEQQLEQVEAVLGKIPHDHPERASVLRVQRIFHRQREGLFRLREFFDVGDEQLLVRAQALLTLDDEGAPVGAAPVP